MKKLLLVSIVFAVCAAYAACAEYAMAYSVEFKKGVQYEAVLAAKIGVLEDFLGKKGLNLDVWGLASLNQETEKGSLGFAVSYPWLVAKASYLDIGAKAKVLDGSGPEVGIFAQFRIQLK